MNRLRFAPDTCINYFSETNGNIKTTLFIFGKERNTQNYTAPCKPYNPET